MFNLSFTRKKPLTPLSDLKSISSWMENLSLRDSYAAHAEILQKLAEFNDELIFSRERLDVLMFLDESSQGLQQGLCKQYLVSPRMSKSTEGKLWDAIRLFYWSMTKAYHGFIMEFVSHPDDSPWTEPLPLITARAMRYFAQESKWHYFHYEPPEVRTWKHLHNLYRFAEFQEFQGQAVQLYDANKHTTTCDREYLQAMMLEKLNSGALYPRQLELADDWLRTWSEGLVLEQRYDDSRHGFFVALNEDRGARRIRNYERDPMTRYWSTKSLTTALTQSKVAIQNGDSQARLKLGEDCKLPACLNLLDSVIAAWTQTDVPRLPRKHARVAAKKIIEVVQGFPQIHARIKEDNILHTDRRDLPISYDEMLDVKMYGFITTRTITRRSQARVVDETKSDGAERWIMENESEQGFGAVIKEKNNDWLKPGKLVGLKIEKHTRWTVGVVRRMQKILPDQFYVGIEIMCRTPLSVELRELSKNPIGAQNQASSATLPFFSIYTSKEEGAANRATLILQNVEYAKGRKLELATRTKSYRIALADSIEKQDDWARAGIEILGAIV